jgi:hypothetical protein
LSRGLPKSSSIEKTRVAISRVFKDDGKRSLDRSSFILKNQTNPKFSFNSITPKPGTITKDLQHAFSRVISERKIQEDSIKRESSMDPNQNRRKASAGYFTGNLPTNPKGRPEPSKKVALNKDLYINRKNITGELGGSKSKFKSSLQDIPTKKTCNSTEKGLRNVINCLDKEKSSAGRIHLDRNSGDHLGLPDAVVMSTSLGEIVKKNIPGAQQENKAGQPFTDPEKSKEKVKDTKQNVFDSILKINQMWEADKSDPVMKNLATAYKSRKNFFS